VNVSLAQSLAPGRAGTVAAFMIGLALGIAGLVMPVLGNFADSYGIERALTFTTFCATLLRYSWSRFPPKNHRRWRKRPSGRLIYDSAGEEN
jgi:hypothetical protein